MARILTLAILATLALLNVGCAVTVQPGNLWVGAQPTWATNKQPPSCSVNQSQNWSNKTTTTSESWSCTQVYDLGDMRCTRSWSESRSNFNAPGKMYDRASHSQYNNPPVCRPLTATEKATRQPK